jgi:acid phosphatase type 7
MRKHLPKLSEKCSSNAPSMDVASSSQEPLRLGHADVVFSGHEHNYERFSPQDPQGRADPEGGIRQFVVGGGGEAPISDPIANSEVRIDHIDGVLKLTLHPKSYEWEFVPVEGESFTDSGGAQCH